METEQFRAGSIGKLLFKLALPAICAQVVNALYNIVDRIYIGNMPDIGGLALTGLGICFPIIMIINACAALGGAGGASIASIKMGARRNKTAERIMGTSFFILLAFGVIITAILLVFREPLLYLFAASENTIGYAKDYLTIYAIGTVFVQISLGMNSYITAQGFAKTSMMTVVIGALLNIILDPIFIFAFHMGVAGAALATILSQGVSAVWVLLFILGKKTTLKLRWKNIRFRGYLAGRMLGLGLSPFIMQSSSSLIQIVFNNLLLRAGGDNYVGAAIIFNSIYQVVMMFKVGITQGSQPIIGYNFGAKNLDRVKKAVMLSFKWCMIIGVSMWTILMTFPHFVVSLFTSDMVIRQIAASNMRIYFAGIFLLGAQMALQTSFVALGQAKFAISMALIRKIVLLIPLAFLFSSLMGAPGVYLSEPISDAIASTITTITFLLFWRKLRRSYDPAYCITAEAATSVSQK